MGIESELKAVGLETWEKAKSRVHTRLLSSEWHSRNLNDLVRVGVAGDVWRTYYVRITDNAIAGITYSMMFAWGVSADDLEAAARANDAGKYTVQSMGDIIRDICGNDMPDMPDLPTPKGMCVVTNNIRNLGAAGILDSSVQSKVVRMFPRGALIAMSSIHECILIDMDSMTPTAYATMIRDINREEVAEEERLSDHVYTLVDNELRMVA